MPQLISVKAKWKWSKELEKFFIKKNHSLSLHVCSGMSLIGDIRVDLDTSSKANIIADMFHLPFKKEVFNTIICDPPYKLAYHKRLQFLYPLSDLLKCNGRLIIKINWIPRIKGLKRIGIWLYEGARYWSNLGVIIEYIKNQSTLDGL